MNAAENELVAAILLEFGGRDDMRIWRQNTGAARTKRGALVRFGIPGQADISGIYHDGRRIEIECKSARGRLRKEQKRWREMIEKHGGIYILARTVEDVGARLRSEGS